MFYAALAAAVYHFAYCAAAAGFVRVYRKPLRRINPLWVLGILVCACQGHALSLIVSLQANNHLNLSVFNMVSVNAWFVACISVFWLWRSSMALGGVVICLVNAAAVALSLIFISDKPFASHLSPGMWWHILTSIAAWTFISLAFLHAALYGWLFRRLKTQTIERHQRFVTGQLGTGDDAAGGYRLYPSCRCPAYWLDVRR